MLINKIAVMQITEKYKKLFPDNNCSEEFQVHIREFEEIIKKEENIQNEIVEFYSEQFFSKDENLAKKELGKKYDDKSIASSLTIMIEIVIVIFLLIGFLLLTYLADDKKSILEINIFFPAFSFTLMIILFLLYIPILLVILKKYKINYIYLLELDPVIINPPKKLMKQFLALLIIWFVLLIGYRASISYFSKEFEGNYFIFAVIVLCLLFIYSFWPFRGLFSKLRICVLITVIKSFLPFSKRGVKFKDFLFADIFTSYAIALANLSVTFCLFYCYECRSKHTQSECHKNIAIPILMIVPALTRIAQCTNLVYYGQKRIIELINVFKYTFHAIDLIVGYLYWIKIVSKEIFIIVISISTCYLFAFDNIIDWNLWDIKSKNFLLRDKLTYPKIFYYFAMVSNAGLRFFWFFGLILPMRRDWSLLISNSLEIYRRAQWCLIRMENEQLFNLEGYRKFLPVPEIPLH